MANILHILNGDAPRPGLERSSVSGTFVAWPDILHEGPSPLALGDEWIRVRASYLASSAHGSEEQILRQYRASDAALEAWREHDEVVFWFEHDLFDQLLLIRHLWWMRAGRVEGPTRFSLVCGTDYLGLLKPEEFGPRFENRRPISVAQIRLGAAAWEAFCGDDPSRLLPFAAAEQADVSAAHSSEQTGRSAVVRAEVADGLPYLPAAMRRWLEEFPAASNGLARSERQILEVLSDGPRTPEQAFVAASRLEEAIYMGDSSFWAIVRAMNAAPHPLLTIDAGERPGRLPDGTVRITETGRAVLAGRADHVALNGISRWLGGTRLSSDRLWRWTGSSLLPPTA